MFDLITIDYIMQYNEHIEIMHSFREPPKRGQILPMFVQKYCLCVPQLILKSAMHYEIFTQSRWKFDIFILSYSYIFYSRIWSPYWIVICIMSANLSHISGNDKKIL